MEQSLKDLFFSENSDDVKLAFLLAREYKVPIEEVNLQFGNIPQRLANDIAIELTDYNPRGNHPKIGRDETGRMRHRFISKWKE